jgi:DNA polymerase I
MKNPEKKPLLVLLDAHAIIHRAYHALPDFATSQGQPTGAIYGFATMILKIIEDLKPDFIVACYDLPGNTFRHESFSEYKGTRSKTDEALVMQFDATRDICRAFAIPVYDAPGFEADDILGTISTLLKNEPIDIIIASGDMDTMQLVDGKRVQIYTLKKGINDTILYDEKALFERFGFKPLSIIDYKALRGDTSDNIPGIRGIGEKTATTLIQKFGNIESMYETLDTTTIDVKSLGITERILGLIKNGREEAEFSKILATIRTDTPVDFRLPEHSWKLSVSLEEALSIFEKFEFRALPARFKKVLGIEEENREVKEGQQNILVDTELLKESLVKLALIDSDFSDAQIDDLFRYTNTHDLKNASQVLDTQIKEVSSIEKLFTFIEKPLMSIVQDMEKTGIFVDIPFLKNLSLEYHSFLKKLEKEIHDIAQVSFNIKSPKQLSEVLFDTMKLPTKGIKKSKTGAYSTNIDTLEILQDEYPIIQKIMEYRELDKLLSTYIDVIPDMVGDDGRLHTEFVQNGAVTGRFSSKNPNMQNIPTRTDLGRKIREAFKAKKGYRLVSFDYSQVELRVLALLSGDEGLIQIFKEGKDIHSAVAARIAKIPEDTIDREMRRKAKIVNFGILYGMGINALKKEMQSSREEAQIFYQGFFTEFPKAAAFLESTKEEARTKGYTETLFGRRRQFKNIHSKLPFIRAMAERMALNAPIQGTAADLIKYAMVNIGQYLKDEKENTIKPLLQIHDEIIYEVPKEKTLDFIEKGTALMEQVINDSFLNYKSPVPFVVHASEGAHWGDLK